MVSKDLLRGANKIIKIIKASKTSSKLSLFEDEFLEASSFRDGSRVHNHLLESLEDSILLFSLSFIVRGHLQVIIVDSFDDGIDVVFGDIGNDLLS